MEKLKEYYAQHLANLGVIKRLMLGLGGICNPTLLFLGFEIPVLKNPILESFLQHNKS